MGTAKKPDPEPDRERDWETLLSRLRRFAEDCCFDEYRDAVTGSRFADTAAGRLELARLELHRDDPAAALALLDRLVEDESGFAPAAAWRIAALDRLSRFADALVAADEAVDRHPDSVDVHVSAARLHAGRGRDAEALAAITTALELDSSDTDALLWRTRILAMAGRVPEAERSAREALGTSPSNQRLRMELGLRLWSADRHTEALAEFDRVLETDATHARALEWRVTVLRDLLRRDEAETAITAAIALRPLVPALHAELAYTLEDLGRHEEALTAIDHAISLRPGRERLVRTRIDVLRALRRWSDAEETARNLIAEFPHKPHPFVYLGWVLSDLGDFDEAVVAYEQALAIDDRNDLALWFRGDVLRAMRRWDEAEATAREYIAKHPNDPDSHLNLGWVLHGLNRSEEALAAYAQALAINDRHRASLAFRIDSLRALRRWDAAEAAAHELHAKFPNDPISHVNLGWVLADQHRDEEALAAYEQALAVDERASSALRGRVGALRTLRRWDEAEAAAREYLAKYPSEPAPHVRVGWVLDDVGRFDEALAFYDQALAIDDQNGLALRSRVGTLRALRRWDEAEAAARECVAKREYDPEACLSLGFVFYDQDRDDQALAAFEEALKVDPHHGGALAWRVAALRALRRWDEAETAAGDLIAKFPSDPGSYVNLGVVLSAQNRDEEALAAFEQALDIDDRDIRALRRRMTALRALRRWDEAETAGREIVAKHPRDPSSHVNLGSLLALQNRDEEALLSFEQALRIDDRDSRALQWRVAALRALRRWEEAETAAHDLVDKRKYDPYSYLELGFVYYDQDRDDQALDAFEQALVIDPRHLSSLEWKIAALRALDRLSDAEAAGRQALAAHPQAPDLHVGMGRIFYDRELYETALSHAERALRIAPTLWNARSFYISCLIGLRRFADAEAAVRDYVAENQNLVPPRLRLAEILDQQHRYEEALAEYEHVRAMDPRNSEVAAGISATLRSLCCFREAEACLRTALEHDPRNTGLSVNLGLVHLDRRDLGAATEVFETLLRDASGRLEKARAYYGLGWIALTKECFDEAATHFEKVATFTPDEPDGFVARAWALMRLGGPAGFDEAEKICRNVLRRHPHASLAHTCLGMIAYHRREFPTAEYHFRRCIDLAPYDGCHVDLGALYTQLGRYEEAEAALRRAAELHPWDTQPSVMLGSLFLQRSDRFRSSDEGTADVEAAGAEFRRVLAADPHSGGAALGLAVALASHKSGDLSAAEDVLRTALRAEITDIPVWQLRLALARLLIQVGDATQQSEPYDSAVLESTEAIKKAGNEAEPYFVAGIAEQRLAGQAGNVRLRVLHQRRAHEFFRKCLERSPDHSEANHAMRLLTQQKAIARASEYRGAAVVGSACLLLAAMWTDFLWKHHVTAVMITTLTPVLIGLMAIGLILPLLIRLKLPGGMEADLSASLDALSAGPPGHVIINAPRLPPIASPSGQLPRLVA